jgi:alpha-tubulin suppressor-like RCC1 family protein
MAGVAYAGTSIAPVQVLGADGAGWDSDVAAGVLWAVDNGATVLLMGFSSPVHSATLADALEHAWSKGAVLVAATANARDGHPPLAHGTAPLVVDPRQRQCLRPHAITGQTSSQARVRAASTDEGVPWAWGDESWGQFGDGYTYLYPLPQSVAGPGAAAAIAAGPDQVVVAGRDGGLWTWGENGYGQLGDGTQIDRPSPAQVPGLAGVVAVGAGEGYSVALQPSDRERDHRGRALSGSARKGRRTGLA